jgi:hypothetical protein
MSFYYTHLGLLFTAPCGRFNIKPRARSMPGTAEDKKIMKKGKKLGLPLTSSALEHFFYPQLPK